MRYEVRGEVAKMEGGRLMDLIDLAKHLSTYTKCSVWAAMVADIYMLTEVD